MLVVDSRVAMAICTELLLAAAAPPPPLDLVASWDEGDASVRRPAGFVSLSLCCCTRGEFQIQMNGTRSG